MTRQPSTHDPADLADPVLTATGPAPGRRSLGERLPPTSAGPAPGGGRGDGAAAGATAATSPAGAPATSAGGDDPFALHLPGQGGGPAVAAALLQERLEGAVARAQLGAAAALPELLAVHRDPAFPALPPAEQGRVIFDLGAAYHDLRDVTSARYYFQLALASGQLTSARRQRALEGLRTDRGGAGAASVPADPAHLAGLEAQVEAGVARSRAEDHEGALAALAQVYGDPAFPQLPPATRARVLFDIAAAAQNARRQIESISRWEEALGSGLLDAGQLARARAALPLARVGQRYPTRPADELAALIDGAVVLSLTDAVAGRDMLLIAYRNQGFAALAADVRGRCLYDLAASFQSLRDEASARAFWIEALNSGGLDAGRRARALDHVRMVMPAGAPVAPARPAPSTDGAGDAGDVAAGRA